MVNNHKNVALSHKSEVAIERILSIVEDLEIVSKRIFNTKEAAKFLGLSESQVYKLVHRRDIPHYKRGKLLRFKQSELEDWLLENPVPTNKEIAQSISNLNVYADV